MAAAKGRKAPQKTTRTEAGDVIATVGLGSVTLSLDEKLYPLSIVHGTAYVFLPRAYVRLDRDKGRTLVRLSGKQKLDRAGLEALAGEFANELTNQWIREEVARKTTRLREAVVGRALLGALGTGDELSGLGEDLGDPTADPLGIAQDWEVRFGRPADKPKKKEGEERLHAHDPNPAAGAEELRARGSEPEPPIPFPAPKAGAE